VNRSDKPGATPGLREFQARRGTVATIDRDEALLTLEPDQHYGGRSRIPFSTITGVRLNGLAGSADTVLISRPPGYKPHGILFGDPDTARSFAKDLASAVRQHAVTPSS